MYKERVNIARIRRMSEKDKMLFVMATHIIFASCHALLNLRSLSLLYTFTFH